MTKHKTGSRANIPGDISHPGKCAECSRDDFDHYEVYVCVKCGTVHRSNDVDTRIALLRGALSNDELSVLITALRSYTRAPLAITLPLSDKLNAAINR
jgi:transcription initiation factor TFIIIB Brf1 subunit/transcription initiation factor TFIIB